MTPGASGASGGGRDVDVMVLGGGPAGAATALALARSGVSVAVVNRSRGDHPRIGETVPPTIMRPLVQLGVWDAFVADGHAPAPGTVVRWGADQPYENDFIVNPYGHGWHLDRCRFDAMLIGAAGRAGAQIQDLPPGGRVEHDDRGWSMRFANRPHLRAPFVIDATGRSARVAQCHGVKCHGVKCHGATRHRVDRLIGLVRFGTSAAAEARTLLEACALGWWYAAVLPDDRAVTALFTDADLLPVGAVERDLWWARALSRTRLVPEIMATTGASRIYAAAAQTGTLSQCTGRGWLAVGDAARTLDPLSGQGLTTALTSAIRAAEAVLGPRRKAALDAFSRQTAEEHRIHLSTRLAYYRRENHWPRSPFWQRRHCQLQTIR